MKSVEIGSVAEYYSYLSVDQNVWAIIEGGDWRKNGERLNR